MAEVGGRGVEEQPGHVSAVRDLEPHRPDPPGDPVEQAELPLLTHPLGAAGALGADVSQERGVRVGDRPPQQGAQSLVRAYVLVVVAWCRQRQGVDGASPAEGAAHHDGGRQRVAEDFEHAALPLREQQWPAAEHERVGRPLGPYGETGDRGGRQSQAVRVGDRANGGDDVAAGRTHAQPQRDVTAEGQLPAAARCLAARGRALLDRERRRPQRLRAVGREHRELSGRGAGPGGELGAGAGSLHRERHQARAGAVVLVEEDALQDLAVVARGEPDTDATATAATAAATRAAVRRHESSAAR